MGDQADKQKSTRHEEEDERDDDYVMAEYEDRFHDIDAKLDALRSSFQTSSSPTTEGATVIVEDDEDDDHSSTLDGSLSSMQVGQLQVSLAEQSATEMQRIVQTLQAQQQVQRTDDDDQPKEAINTASSTIKLNEGIATTVTTTKGSPSWILLVVAVLLPTLIATVSAYQLWWTASLSTTTLGNQRGIVVQQQQPAPAVHYQQTFTRQVCRMINGQRYCESDSESQATTTMATNAAAAANTGQQREIRYQRQQCQYVNGESYCESYQESRSTTGGSSGYHPDERHQAIKH